MKRMTVKNSDSSSYRIEADKAESFIIESFGLNIAFRGQMIDRLGKYEDYRRNKKRVLDSRQ